MAKKATKKTPDKTPRAPAQKTAKKATTTTAKKAPVKLRSPRDRRKLATDYDKRNIRAKEKGFESYWDERQSRTRAREALAELGHPHATGVDKPTLNQVDQLGVMGRGKSARDLYYETKTLIEEYQGPATDQEIWALIRVFYKPRSHR